MDLTLEEAQRNITKYEEFDIDEDLVQTVRAGPVESDYRKSSDQGCVWIVLLISVVMLIGVIINFISGDPKRFGIPHDPDHRACGLDPPTQDHPFIYFAVPFKEYAHRATCVKSCPDESVMDGVNFKLDCVPNSLIKSCKFSHGGGDMNKSLILYRTVPFLNRVCLPESTKYYSSIRELMLPYDLESNLGDIYIGWLIIGASLFINFILGIILILLTQKFPKFMTWTCLISYLIALTALATIFLINSRQADQLQKARKQDLTKLENIARSEGYYYMFLFYAGITLATIDVLSVVCLLLFIRQIPQLIFLIEGGAHFLKKNLGMFVVPFISLGLMMLFFIYWTWATMYIFSNGEMSSEPLQHPFNQFKLKTSSLIFFVLHLLSLFYIFNVFVSWSQYTVADAASFWYLNNNSETPETMISIEILRKSFYRSLRFHKGSILLGSFLLLAFGPLSYFLSFVREILQKLACCQRSNRNNSCIKNCVSAIYFEFLECISSLAFIGVALTGEPFLSSGKKVVKVVDKYFGKYSLYSFLCTIFLLVGNMFVSALTVIICYYLYDNIEYFYKSMSSSILPLTLIGVFSLVSGSVLLNTFYVSIETLLLCIFVGKLDNEERNGNAFTSDLKTLTLSNCNTTPIKKMETAIKFDIANVYAAAERVGPLIEGNRIVQHKTLEKDDLEEIRDDLEEIQKDDSSLNIKAPENFDPIIKHSKALLDTFRNQGGVGDYETVSADLEFYREYSTKHEEISKDFKEYLIILRTWLKGRFKSLENCFQIRTEEPAMNNVEQAEYESLFRLMENWKPEDMIFIKEDLDSVINTTFEILLINSQKLENIHEYIFHDDMLSKILIILGNFERWNQIVSNERYIYILEHRMKMEKPLHNKVLELPKLANIQSSIKSYIIKHCSWLNSLDFIIRTSNADRKLFYKDIKRLIKLIQTIKEDPSILKNAFPETCLKELEESCSNAFEHLLVTGDMICKNINAGFKTAELSIENAVELYILLKSCKYFEEELDQFSVVKERTESKYIALYKEKIAFFAHNAMNAQDYEQMTESLEKLKILETYIPIDKGFSTEELTRCLIEIRVRRGPVTIKDLAEFLQVSSVGKLLIEEHEIFKGVRFFEKNERLKMMKRDVDSVLEKMRGTKLNKELLKNSYFEFYQLYEEIVYKTIQNAEQNISKMNEQTEDWLQIIKGAINNIRSELTQKQDSYLFADPSDDLLFNQAIAHLFALWTLLNSSYYFEDETADKNGYLPKPYITEVFAVFRMFGVGDDDEGINNCLIEIPPGEGRSLVIGIAGCLMALMSYDVIIATPNDKENVRNLSEFDKLIENLNISSSKLRFITIDELFEELIDKKKGIRKAFEQIITTGELKDSSLFYQKELPVLLIDECVDSFLSKIIYNNCFRPLNIVSGPEISSLIKTLWDCRYESSNYILKEVRKRKEYESCAAVYKGQGGNGDNLFFLDWCLAEFLSNLKAFIKRTGHQANIAGNGKSGYQILDESNVSILNNYEALFTTLDSSEDSDIVGLGQFLYAEKTPMFQFIMGVTNTLDFLSKTEIGVSEEEFKLINLTTLPSVLWENNANFYDGKVISYNNEKDVESLMQSVQFALKNTLIRATLVYFESDEAMMKAYYQIPDLHERIQTITQRDESYEIDFKCKVAMNKGWITFISNKNPKDLNFVLRDREVQNNGGVHVIQTYLCTRLSEEYYLVKQTGNPGMPGSLSIYASYEALENFGVSISQNKGDQKRLIEERRMDLENREYEYFMMILNKIGYSHDNTRRIVSAITDKKKPALQKHIKEMYLHLIEYKKVRVLIIIDGMKKIISHLNMIASSIEKMFGELEKELIRLGLNKDLFEIQVAVFRPTNIDPCMSFGSSSWESEAKPLMDFFNALRFDGAENELDAIQRCLLYANEAYSEIPISKVILLGVSPEAQIFELALLTENNERSNTMLNMPSELKKLRESGVTISSVSLEALDWKNIGEIGKLLGGSLMSLCEEKKQDEELAKFLASEVLEEIRKI